MHQRILIPTIVIAVALALALTGCGTPSTHPSAAHESSKTGNTQPRTPTPTPKPNLLAPPQGVFTATDKSGYDYKIGYRISLGRFTSDISAAKPGFFDAVATITSDQVAVTNITDGRTSDGIPEIGGLIALYPQHSLVCGVATDGSSNGKGPEWLFSAKKAGYCGVQLTHQLATDPGAPLPPSQPTALGVTPDIPGSSTEVRISNVAEAHETSFLAALEQPTALVISLGYADGANFSDADYLDTYALKADTQGCLIHATLGNGSPQGYWSIYDPEGTICG